MVRTDALRSCSNSMLIMSSLVEDLAGLRANSLWRTMRARATGDGICRGGSIDNVAGPDRADHRRRTRGHVLRTLAAQLRAAPCRRRAGDRIGRHGAAKPLS